MYKDLFNILIFYLLFAKVRQLKVLSSVYKKEIVKYNKKGCEF